MDQVPTIAGTDANASSTDPTTWCSFEDAVDAYESGCGDGIGFVIAQDDPYTGIDLDNVRDKDTGVVTPAAQDIIDNIDSYTEVSPSGTGVHVFVRGALPGKRRRKGHVEMYDHARFLCMTGRCFHESHPYRRTY